MDKFILGLLFGAWCVALALVLNPMEPEVKYIYDTEARLVGFCSGKYLIRTDSIGRDAPSEDEFPSSGCMFIEPITLGSEADVS